MISDVEAFPNFIETLPEVELPFRGSRGWLVQGENQQVVFLTFDETLQVPAHSHAEQWEFVLAGTATLRTGGTSRDYHAGENFFIPAGIPHSATVHAGYKAMIVFNSRDRYRPKTG